MGRTKQRTDVSRTGCALERWRESFWPWHSTKDAGGLDLKECFVDGTFVPAKKGALVGKTKRARAPRSWAIADRHGLPLALRAKVLRQLK